MNRKLFLLYGLDGRSYNSFRREDEFVDSLIPLEDGKPIDDLTMGEICFFHLPKDGKPGIVVKIQRIGDDQSISYGPFLTAKEYGSSMIYLAQAVEDLRLAAHHVHDDPVLERAVTSVGTQIIRLRQQFADLKKLAEEKKP